MANSFQKLADILNIETARLSGDPRRLQVASQMQETKELKQATAQSEAEINKAIDESNLPESQKRLLKAMDLASKTKVLYEAQTQRPEAVPADIQKLERFGFLKSKLDETSPNYDPTYTVEMLNQEASLLGVNARLLDQSKNQFIVDYIKDRGKLKTVGGQPLYNDAQLKTMAEETYNLIYGNNTSPTNDGNGEDDGNEDAINLGAIQRQ
jgi:hypothetical protein